MYIYNLWTVDQYVTIIKVLLKFPFGYVEFIDVLGITGNFKLLNLFILRQDLGILYNSVISQWLSGFYYIRREDQRDSKKFCRI